jgi:hypothetical protein
MTAPRLMLTLTTSLSLVLLFRRPTFTRRSIVPSRTVVGGIG